MSNSAFGAPGAQPAWQHADKDGVGAAYSSANRVWFSLWRGMVTEVFYPHVDRAQVRDMQVAVTDGRSFLHCEDSGLGYEIKRLDGRSQAYSVTRTADEPRYKLEKTVICDPDLPALVQHYCLNGGPDGLRCYVLCTPHLADSGFGAEAHAGRLNGRWVLIAHKANSWLAVGTDCGFDRTSVGFVGASDGLTDLHKNYRMDFEFSNAENGNVMLTGELPERAREFTVVLGFGDTEHGALTAVAQSLSARFETKRDKYLSQWKSARSNGRELAATTTEDGRLYDISFNTLCTHEDRSYPGAIIASLAVPWGQARKAVTAAHAGYHLVWPRDAVNAASALLAASDADTPLRTLTYLAVSQRADGSFAQNFWVDGEPKLTGLQLDEVTYPVLLARRLYRQGALKEFNPLPMVLKAAEYIVHAGPITPQERWEEKSGYSPSTLAVVISAMVCAAAFAREDGKTEAAAFLETYADWMRDHIEAWTVTTQGELMPDLHRYMIRITPADPGEGGPVSPNDAILQLPDQPPGAPTHYPARNVVDAGFLELVRYGIVRADDPIVEDSVRVVDACLKVDTPFGPSWRRFNHDGYGQRDDGAPFDGWGKGRAWPLLTGERGHYELRAGRDPRPYLAAMEGFAGATGLLPEQVWDQPFRNDGKNCFGRPTGSANPLVWAHAEYIKLVRSAADGRVYDLMPEVEQRYSGWPREPQRFAMWTPHYPAWAAESGQTLRVYARKPFRLRCTLDNWSSTQDIPCTSTEIAIHFADVPIPRDQKAPVRFTFFWTETGRWHASDYSIEVLPVAT